MNRSSFVKNGIICLIILLLASCSTSYVPRNILWETPLTETSPLAILEFTERGNLRDRSLLFQLENDLDQLEKSIVVVYIHGWKHNAAPSDSNLIGFKDMLKTLQASRVIAPSRKVVGLYIGWPGASIETPVLENLTFWARKKVAEEIGKGGITELLLKLEKIQNDKNRMFVTIGHSFGGAIVTSALSEVLMSKIINSDPATGCSFQGIHECNEKCVESKGFGDAVVVINPAIEANQILPFKSTIAESCYPPTQKKIMHILTTNADDATNKLFPRGQKISMFFWQEEEIEMEYRGEDVLFHEHDLDTSTIGNFQPFWTGRLITTGRSITESNQYEYCSLAKGSLNSCSGISPSENAIPSRIFEPLSVISAEKGFMDNHNDIFNKEVVSYLATVVRESITKREKLSNDGISISCYNNEFLDFDGCFKKHLNLLN